MVTTTEMCLAFIDKNLAFSKAGIVERTGHNDGEYIDKVESVFGLKGQPYCAMGQYWAFAKAYLELKGEHVTPSNIVDLLKSVKAEISSRWQSFNPACINMIEDARKKHTLRDFDSRDDITRVLPGSLMLFDFGSESKHERHIGMFHKHDHSHMYLVEWNTTPVHAVEPTVDVAGEMPPKKKETNDPKGGCFYKYREPDPSVVTGWIEWQAEH